jgi:hypothetical protein
LIRRQLGQRQDGDQKFAWIGNGQNRELIPYATRDPAAISSQAFRIITRSDIETR